MGSGTGAAGAEGLRLFSISSWMRDSIEEVVAGEERELEWV